MIRLPRRFQFIAWLLAGLLFVLMVPAASARWVPDATAPSEVRIAVENDPQALVRLGRERYRAGEYAEAAAALERAAAGYRERGDGLNRAIALNYLSLTRQRQGQWEDARSAISSSLGLIGVPGDGSTADRQRVFASALTTRGQLQLALGQAEAAFETWQRGERAYRTLGDREGEVGSQINQARALEALGLHRRSCNAVLGTFGSEDLTCDGLAADEDAERERQRDRLLEAISQQPDSEWKAMALRSLGNRLRVLGQLEQSERILHASLNSAQSNRSLGLSYLNLGNTARAMATRDLNLRQFDSLETYANTALGYYQRAIDLSQSPSLKIQGQLNRLDLLSELIKIISQKTEYLQTQITYNSFFTAREDYYREQIEISKNEAKLFHQEAFNLIEPIQSQLRTIPLSRIKVDSQLKLACNLIDCSQINLKQSPVSLQRDRESVTALLQEAIAESQELGNLELQSHAYGILGKFYEQQGQWEAAIEATRKALALSNEGERKDISYQWQWQMGRILQSRYEQETQTKAVLIEAVGYYKKASGNLKKLRQEIAALNSNIQYNFRDKIEPVYRQFVELLLRDNNSSQEFLEQARNAIEDLQIAELDNFFQDACVTQEKVTLDEVVDRRDPTAALIYTIILEDRLHIVLKLPQQNLYHYSVRPPERNSFKTVFWETYNSLIDVSQDQDVKTNANKLYKWLISPIEAKLEESNIQTIIFVLDTTLRRIPMSVLYDRKTDKFLLEKYAIAITPGITIMEPRPFEKVEINTLAAGLSEEREGYSELPGVLEEIQEINRLLPTQVLLNKAFTRQAIERWIDSVSFSVIHLATHGNFSSNPDRTFLLLSDGFLKVQNIDNVFQVNQVARSTPIELLVMSACKTATGDERAALGLAGMAVRSGARSTLATLWPAGDESTAELMGQFYRNLKTGQSKAEALRQAQLQLFEKDPTEFRIWAPYILVGNWL